MYQDFWNLREDRPNLQQTEDLRRLIFSKQMYPVPQDLWIPGEGNDQCISAMVSGQYVLQQLKDVVFKREEWLTRHGLATDFQMRNGPGLERARFLKHCKDEYHAEPFQLSLQKRDAETRISGKVKSGKHSRWSRELQRRLGTKVLWEVVSFTGRFRADYLTQVNNVRAPQPASWNQTSARKTKLSASASA